MMKCLTNRIILLIPLIALLVSLNLNSRSVEGKNILFYWGSASYSHRISVWPIVEKLAKNGHTITFLSPFPSRFPKPIPNVTDFVPKNLDRDTGWALIDFVSVRITDGVTASENFWSYYEAAGTAGCESILKNPEVIEWVKKSSFDLVVINSLFNDCGYGLAYKFKAPHIIYSSTSPFPWWVDAYGLPEENWPEMQYHFGVNMTFGQSVWNGLRSLSWQWRRYREIFPKLEEMFKKHLQMEDLPSFFEIERNTSLILVSTHFSEEFPRSLPPMVIPIAGMHCTDETKALDKSVVEFIEAGDDGFIYLSFGTLVTLANLPDTLQETFMTAMANMNKIQFLVKHDGEFKKDIPKNVKLVTWISQQDVLAHPKIRAFISHGGLQGTQEAVYHGVPMIIIPLFAEQDFNAVRSHARGTGIMLEISELNEEKLTSAISDILSNEKYKINMKRLSDLFKDRPQKPVDTATWWIEYVLRNKDLSHLQPAGIHKNWFKKRMLDIWGFLAILCLTVFVVSIGFLYILAKRVYNILFGTTEEKKTKTRNQNITKNNKKSN